ncbi:TonB-dependent receptor [Microbulbifer elongatus]|uniref:TonB-dependent receptor n=1 Tax=Microbulbifer elongatus TaxID=86173 RepID=A0ABT1NWZ8_9GAMM|nr:TonB-dependent receptor [Microbulbifer elongatus]MCQ3828417.1 TonB-dependent receptor [Microbulbifer elongatus]
MKKNLLSVAVAASIMVPALPAFAQEDAALVEEVIVTGSRIASAVADTPRPVTTVTLEDIQLTGADTVADYLRNSAYNTLGSYRDQSGSSFGSVQLVDLKGLGADRTAVLVNGRRVPGNPWTGTSAVDIGTIPMAAVERVEILTDSASAIYGADAIGGVVNIIMKKDWEGAEFSAGTSNPTRDDATSENASFTIGTSSDRGSMVFSAEYVKKNTIYDRDRAYSAPLIKGNSGAGGLPVDGTDVQGINGGGNSAFTLDFSEALGVIGPCNSAGLTPVADPFGVPGTGCGYSYANFSAASRGYERRSTFLAGEFKINDDHSIFVENRFTNKEDAGRFAPAIGGFFFDADSPFNDLGQDALLYHRFVAHGTRDDKGITDEMDTTFGITGNLLNGDVNYEVYARDYRFSAADYGENYVLASVISDLVASGDYNPVDPFAPENADAIAQSKASLSRDISTIHEGYGVTFDGVLDRFQLSGGAIGWAAGWESAREAYTDKYDSYREAGNVLGSAGISAAGSRSRQAFFAEAELPVFDNFTTNIAARFDEYNDVGGEFSPMLSMRYQPMEMLTLRASLGEGFKAPNLTDLHQPYAQSFLQTPDKARCEALGTDPCPSSQLETYTGGNPELEPEETSSWNVGMVLAPVDSLTLSLDWWNVKIDGAVDSLSLDDLLAVEATGSLPSGVYVNRAPSSNGVPGPITRCEGTGLSAPDCGVINVYANLAEREVEGVDLKANWSIETGIGGFEANVVWSHLNKYNEILPVLGLKEQAGTQSFPEDKVNLGLRYRRDDLTVAYNYTWLAETESDYNGVFPSWGGHDVSVVYTAPFGTEFTLGVLNLTDEDPTIESATGWNSNTSSVSMALTPISGRVYTGTIRHRF